MEGRGCLLWTKYTSDQYRSRNIGELGLQCTGCPRYSALFVTGLGSVPTRSLEREPPWDEGQISWPGVPNKGGAPQGMGGGFLRDVEK